MNSLFKRLQEVVELGEEDALEDITSGYSVDGATLESLPSDPQELKLSLQLASKKFQQLKSEYADLRRESCDIEAKLASVRVSFATARELFSITEKQHQRVIQLLLEARVYDDRNSRTGGSPFGGNVEGIAAVSSSLSAAAAAVASAGGGGASSLLQQQQDPFYLSALEEQCSQLREMLRESIEERNAAQREAALYVGRGIRVRTQDSESRTEMATAVQKLQAHWTKERDALEAQVVTLEEAAVKNAEAMALLVEAHNTDLERAHHQQKQHRNISTANAEGSLTQTAVEMTHSTNGSVDTASSTQLVQLKERVEALGTELEQWRSGAKRHSEVQESIVISTKAQDNEAASAEHEPLDTHLQLLRQECSAKEEALASMYADAKRMQETERQLRAELTAQRETATHALEALEYAGNIQVEQQQRCQVLEGEVAESHQMQAKLRRELTRADDAMRRLRQEHAAAALSQASSAAAEGATVSSALQPPQTALLRGAASAPGLRQLASSAATLGNPFGAHDVDAAKQRLTIGDSAATVFSDLSETGVRMLRTRSPRQLVIWAIMLVAMLSMLFVLLIPSSSGDSFGSDEYGAPRYRYEMCLHQLEQAREQCNRRRWVPIQPL